MENVERIDEWRGQDVLDCTGEKIGKVDEVFYATGGGAAEFVAVKRGLLGRRSHIAPLLDATVARDYIRLAFTQEQVGQSGGATDGALDRASVEKISSVYGIDVRATEYESASLIEERRVEAEEARRRADELESEAQERISEITAARRDADDAASRADQIERDGQRAREDAATARAEADALEARRRQA